MSAAGPASAISPTWPMSAAIVVDKNRDLEA